jgi:predicted ABC-type ATPase
MSSPDRPSVVVIGGPNGAGKSTIAPRVLQGTLAVSEFVNADVIARGLSAFNPEGAALAAGRIMLERLRELAAQRSSFAFETTLASRSFAPWIRDLIATGYEFHLVYVWIASPDLSVERIAGRVRLGGHHVPEEVARRRYAGGLRNFFDLYRPLAATWRLYDNNGRDLCLIASGDRGGVVTVHDAATWNRIYGEAAGQTWREDLVERKDLSRIGRLMLEGTAVDEAARQGVRDALLAHKRAGVPIAIMEDGKVVLIPADEIEIDDPSEKPAGQVQKARRVTSRRARTTRRSTSSRSRTSRRRS